VNAAALPLDPVILVLGGVFVVLIVVIVIASVHHTKKAGFKPVFVRLSDGSVEAHFKGFSGMQTSRTARFREQFHVGDTLVYGGRDFEIVEIREQSFAGIAPDVRMVAYLRPLA
jgi:hypothetical protein